MHVHANLPELTRLYGLTDCYNRNLHTLHFPVGGHRFRPTLEELLFFINEIGLAIDWQEGWKQYLKTTYREWKKRQARSVVRSYLIPGSCLSWNA